MNPHYLKTNNDITSDIPVAEIESVPLKIQGIPYLRFISIFFLVVQKETCLLIVNDYITIIYLLVIE